MQCSTCLFESVSCYWSLLLLRLFLLLLFSLSAPLSFFSCRHCWCCWCCLLCLLFLLSSSSYYYFAVVAAVVIAAVTVIAFIVIIIIIIVVMVVVIIKGQLDTTGTLFRELFSLLRFTEKTLETFIPTYWHVYFLFLQN